MACLPLQITSRARSNARSGARTILRTLVRTVSAGLCIGLLSPSLRAAEGPDFSHDITLSDIMASIVMPAADVLWAAAYPDSTPQGEVIVGPDSEEAWLAVRAAAVGLAASTNLLLIPDLPVKDPALASETPPGELAPQAIGQLIKSQGAAWTAWSKVMNATALQALGAVDKRDAKALYDITGALDGPCTSCHQQFWYPE